MGVLHDEFPEAAGSLKTSVSGLLKASSCVPSP